MDSLIDCARDQEPHQVDYAKKLEMLIHKRTSDDDTTEESQFFQNNNGSFGGLSSWPNQNVLHYLLERFICIYHHSA